MQTSSDIYEQRFYLQFWFQLFYVRFVLKMIVLKRFSHKNIWRHLRYMLDFSIDGYTLVYLRRSYKHVVVYISFISHIKSNSFAPTQYTVHIWLIKIMYNLSSGMVWITSDTWRCHIQASQLWRWCCGRYNCPP